MTTCSWSGSLTEDEQQLLRAAEREHGDEAAAAACHDVAHQARESGLALLAFLVDVCAVRRLL